MSDAVIQTVLGGLGTGSIYALLGLSFSLIFGKLRICSYMNGDLSILAAYICFTAFSQLGLDPILTAILLCPLFFLIGYMVQNVFLKRFMTLAIWQGRYQAQIMVTWGLGMIIMAFEYMIWSGTYRTTSVPYRTSVIRFGEISVPYIEIAALGSAILVYVLLQLWLHKTHMGISLRACSDDRTSAILTGINFDRICAVTFGVSAVLAVIAGLFFTLTSQLTPSAGMELTFKGWMAVIVGGMGSLGGTIIAGLLIGVVEALTSYFWVPHLKEAVVFLGLILLLIFKPEGLIAKRKMAKAK